MKQLHKQSILECTELEEAIHQAEIDRISEVMASLPNYDCDISVTYEDDYHKHHWSPYALETSLHRYEDVIRQEDIKNGVDYFLTRDNALAIRAYGQGYTYQGQSGILTTLITVKPYGEGMAPIDLSQVFSTLTQPFEPEWTD